MRVPYESRDSAIRQTCCVLGETPDELGVDPEIADHWVKDSIQEAIDKGYRTFIIACDIGCCCTAAEAVLEHKKEDPSVRFIAARSELEKEKDRQMDFADFSRIQRIVSEADYQRLIPCGVYNPKELHIRNEWIVDHGHYIIALYRDGKETEIVKYAEERGKDVQLFDKE